MFGFKLRRRKRPVSIISGKMHRAQKRSGRRSVGRLTMAVSATFAALFGSDRAFAKGVVAKGVSAGSATIQQKGGNTTVTATSKNTVIDYSSFDLTPGESARFNLPSRNARLLNRIDSPDPSHIDGHVLSNGVIYFVNPAGVMFGPTAVIDVAGLFAAAAHISNADFLAGINHFTAAGGSVINQGTLKGDVVTLVGRQAQNSGVILGAQNVTIVSGGDVLVGERFGNIYVKLDPSAASPTAASPALSMGSGDLMAMAIMNSGLIQSPDVRVQAGAKGAGGSVALSGHIDAASKTGIGGTVTVTGDNVALVGAAIDASGKTAGGTVLVGGDTRGTGALQNANTVAIDAASALHADATGTVGAGGKVVVWSDVSTAFHGSITARGGGTSGDGGFVETSGHLLDITGGTVDAHAVSGKAGVWLLDPAVDIDIVSDLDVNGALQGDTTTVVDPAATVPTYVAGSTVVAPTAATIKASTIAGELNTGTSVTVQTTDNDNGVGSINLKTTLSVTQTSNLGQVPTLTLNSAKDINIAAPISATTPLSLDFEAAGNVKVTQSVATAGGDFKSGGVDFSNTRGPIDTTGAPGVAGNFTLNHTGAVTVEGAVNAGTVKINAAADATGTVFVGAAVTTNGQPFSSTGGGAFKSTTFGTITTTSATTTGDVTITHPTIAVGGAIQAGNTGNVSLLAQAATAAQGTPPVGQSSDSVAITGNIHAGSVNVVTDGSIAVGDTLALPITTTISADAQSYTAGSALTDVITFAPLQTFLTDSSPLNGILSAPQSLSLTQGPSLPISSLLSDLGLSLSPKTLSLTSLAAPVSLDLGTSTLLTLGATDITLGGTDVTLSGSLSPLAALSSLHLKASHEVFVDSPSIVTATGNLQLDAPTIQLSLFDANGLPMSGAVTLGATTGKVILNGSVQSAAGTSIDLSVKGNAILAGVNLNSLDVSGLASISAGSTVNTAAAQTFEKAATVTGAGTTHFTSAGALTFDQALSSGTGGTIDRPTVVTADVFLQGTSITLGGGAKTTSLTVTGPLITGGDIITPGLQSFSTDVTTQTTASALQFSAGAALTFAGGLTATGVDVTTKGSAVQFWGNVAAASLNNTGPTTIGAPKITTTDNAGQTFTGDLTLSNTANPVDFIAHGAAPTIAITGQTHAAAGAQSAQFDFDAGSTGSVVFGGSVGAPINGVDNSLVSVTVNNGATTIGAPGATGTIGVYTTTGAPGNQAYSGKVTLNADALFRGYNIALNGGLDGGGGGTNHSLELANAGNFTLDTSVLPVANINNLTLGDSSAVAGATTTVKGSVGGVHGLLTFNDPTTVAAVVGGPSGVTLSAGGVVFNNTLDGAGVGVTVNGAATFNANVGGTLAAPAPLGDLKVGGDVTIGQAGGVFNVASLSVTGALKSANTTSPDVNIASAGDVKVTSGVSLGSLTVTANGANGVEIDGTSIQTDRAQTYNSPLSLGGVGEVDIGGTGLSFAKLSGTGADVLADAKSGVATFSGGVTLDSLNVTGSKVAIATGTVHTTHDQKYNAAVALSDGIAVSLASTGGNVTLGGSVTGNASALTVSGLSAITLAGNVGTSDHPLASLAVNAIDPLNAQVVGSLKVGSGTGDVAIQTSGNQSFDVADITLAANVLLNAGGAVQFTKIDGGNAFDLTLKTAQALSLSGASTSPSALGDNSIVGLNNLTTGPAAGALGVVTTLHGAILTQAAQHFGEDVALAGVTSLTGSTVAFDGKLDAVPGAAASGLSVTANTTTFSDAIGSKSKLDSLTTSAATIFSGGSIETAGDQKFGGAATLTKDASFTSDNAGAITLGSTTDGNFAVTIKSAGTATFTGAVTVGSLTTIDAGGSTAFATNAITTTGAQTFGDATTVAGANTVFKSTGGSDLAFAALTGRAVDVMLDTAGIVKLNGAVDLNSLNVLNASTIATTAITTAADQTFGGKVTLSASPTLSSRSGGTIKFASAVDGAQALTLKTGGSAVFGGDVTVASISVNPALATAGSVVIGNITVKTTGAQAFNATTLNLAGDATLDAGGTIGFTTLVGVDSALNHYNLTLKTPTALTVSGTGSPVMTGFTDNVITGVKNLTIGQLADGASFLTNIRWTLATTASQVFNDKIQLIGDTTLASTGGSPITLQNQASVSGNFGLTTQTSGTTTFGLPVNVGSVAVQNGLAQINGGSVQTTGAQTYSAAVVLGGASPVLFQSSRGGAITFADKLTGVTSQVTVNSADTTTFGGVVNLGSLTIDSTGTYSGLTSITGGAITTTGDAAGDSAKQIFNDAVSVGAGGAVFTTGGDAAAQLGVSFAKALNAIGSVSIVGKGPTLFGGAVNVTAGNLTTDAAGAGTTIKGGLVNTSGLQDFGDAVTVTAPIGNLAIGATTFAAGDKITFEKALTGTSGDVIVNTAANTTFNGAVTIAAGGVATDAPGHTFVNGGLIQTDNGQTFGDAVTIGTPALTHFKAGGAIAFNNTLDGGGVDTQVTAATGATFLGTVKLDGNLTSDGAAATTVKGGLVQTVGSLAFADVVDALPTATPATTLFHSTGSSPIDFKFALNSSGDVTVTTAGDITLGGVVTVTPGAGANGNFTANGGGATFIQGGAVTTAGSQDFFDATILQPVTRIARTIFTSNATGDINFHSTLASGGDVTVNTAGVTTFGGAVNLAAGANSTGSLTTDAAGSTHVDGNLIQTAGSQTFGDLVTVGTTPALTLFTAGGPVTFSQTLDGGIAGQNVQVTTSADTTFVGTVKLLGNFITDGGGTSFVEGGIFSTGGSQDFADKVQVSPTASVASAPTLFTSINAGTIKFEDTLVSTGSVTVTSGGEKTFDGAVTVTAAGTPGDFTVNGGGNAAVNGGSVISTGLQNYADTTTVNPKAGNTFFQSTGSAPINFAGTLTGASNVELSTAGVVTFGDHVVLAAGANSSSGNLQIDDQNGSVAINGHLIQTDGFQDYRELTTIQIASGSTLFTSQNNAFIHFHKAFTAAGDVGVTTAGDTIFDGNVTVAANTTTQGSLTTDHLGTTYFNGPAITTDGFQSFVDDVVIGTQLATFLSHNAGAIHFNETLTGAGSALVSTAGLTTFDGRVNLGGSLTTDTGGTTAVNGASVTTGLFQQFSDDVTVNPNANAGLTTFLTTGNGKITFARTLGGASDVTVTTSGDTTFAGTVILSAGNDGHGNLFTNGGGNTIVRGRLVQTAGSQDFADDVQVTPNTVDPFPPANVPTHFASIGNAFITFEKTLTGTDSVTVTTDGVATFGGHVLLSAGNGEPGDLLVNGAGDSIVQGRLIQTDGLQHFVGNVQVLPNTALGSAPTLFTSINNATITFDKKLTGIDDVEVSTAGLTTFGGQVILQAGNGGAGNLTTDGGGNTTVNGGLVRTDGSQHFFDDVQVNPTVPPTLFHSVNDAFVHFEKSVTGIGDVTVTTGGLTTFGGLVDLNGNLTTNGNAPGSASGITLIQGRLVRTTGFQDFADDVQVAPDARLPQTAGVPAQPLTLFTSIGVAQPIHFERSLTGTSDVTVTTAGDTTFGGVVKLGGAAGINGDLITDGGGNTIVQGRLVQTAGLQHFLDDVIVTPNTLDPLPGAAPTLFTSLNNATITFDKSLTGTDSVTVTTAGLTTFGGLVDLTAGGNLITNGGGNTLVEGRLVLTDGFQDFFDDVQVSPNASLPATALVPANPLTLFKSATDQFVHFETSLTGTGNVQATTDGDTTFGGLVNVTGSLLTDGGGKTIVQGRLIQTGTTQDFKDDVIVAPNASLPATALVPTNPLTLFKSTGDGTIHYEKTLTGSGDVQVTTAGLTTFDGLVNVTGSLTTDGGGVSAVNGASITTGAFQLFRDDVTVNPNAGLTTFLSTGNDFIKFESSLTGASDVTVTTSGLTTFGGQVILTIGNGGSANLLTNGGGITVVRGRLVQTDGHQDFADDVQVTPNDVDPLPPAGVPTHFVSVGNAFITFEKSLTGTDSVTVTTDGVTTFGGHVVLSAGNGMPGDLLVNGAGDAIVEGRLVQTDGYQHYLGNVQVLPNTALGSAPTLFTSLNNAVITFDKKLTGVDDVEVTTAGLTTFGGQVILHAGNGGAGNLTTDGGGNTTVNGSLVQTDGFQHFFDDVIVAPVVPPTLFHSMNDAFVHFEKSLTGVGDVTVTTGGLTTFGGLVDLNGNLTTNGNASGAASGITQVEGRLVRTTGFQDFADDVVVAPNGALPQTSIVPAQSLTLFTSTGLDQPIHFERSLTGTSDVTVTTAGDTTFGGVVKLGGAARINGDLITDGGGNTVVQGRLVQTAGLQHFLDDVIVTPNTVDPLPGAAPTLFTSLNNATITFDKSLTGTDSVTVTTAGLTTFGGMVDLTAGGNLITDGGGNTLIEGRLVLTDGFQHFFDDVQLAPDASLPATALVPASPLTLFKSATDQFIHFEMSLTGDGNAQVTTNGDTTFGGLVNITGSLLTDGGGKTIVQGRLVETGTSQDFKDDVVVAPNAALPATAIVPGSPLSLFKSTGDQFIKFEKTLTGTGDVQVTTAGDTTFAGFVNLSTGSLTTDGGGNTIVGGRLVSTGTFQLFRDDVQVLPTAGSTGAETLFVSTGNGTVTFQRSLTGSDNVHVTTSGDTTFGGFVDVVGNLTTDAGGITIVAGRLVQTTGFQDFLDDVKVAPDSTWPTTGSVPAPGQTLFRSTANNAITFEQSLTGSSDVQVTTGGLTTFKGLVNLVGNLATDGNPGGDLGTVIGAAGVTGAGQVTTTGSQTYGDNVKLGTDAHLISTGGLDVTFDGTITGDQALVTSTAGHVIFEMPVNIGSLQTDGYTNPAAGIAVLNGHGILPFTIDTLSFQDYKNAVQLGGDAMLNSANAGAITFEGTVTGPHNLVVNTAGVTTFQKTVDIGTLLTDAPGTTAVDGGTGAGFTIRTSGFQNFKDSVTLGADAIFASTGAGDITFNQNLTGSPFNATVNTVGTTTFKGQVATLSLTTDVGGKTVIGDGSVTGHGIINTGSFQLYNDDVVLGTDSTLTAGGDVTFSRTVTGPQSLVIETGAITKFLGSVNITNLTTDAPGSTAIDGGIVTTSGFQHYHDNVTLDNVASTVLTAGSDILFDGTVVGTGSSLRVTVGTTDTFNKAVTVQSLTIDPTGTSLLNGPSITTTGSQDYGNPVILGGQALTLSATAGDVTFHKTLSGPSALTIDDHGVTTFDDLVSGLASLKIIATDGQTHINTPTISTSGFQDYANALTFTDALTFTSTGGGALTFRSTVTGSPSLTVDTTGLATFMKDVTAQSFNSDKGGTTEIDAGLTTQGLITFNDVAHLANVAHLKSNNNAITFNGGSELSGKSIVESGKAVITFKGTTTIDGTAVAITSQAGQATAAANKPGVDFEGATFVTGVATVNTTDAYVKFANTLGGAASTSRSAGSLSIFSGAGDVSFLKAIGGAGKSNLDLTVDATHGSDAAGNRSYLGNATFTTSAAVRNLTVDAQNISVKDVTAADNIALQPSPTLNVFNYNTIPVDSKVNRLANTSVASKDPTRDQRPYTDPNNPQSSGILKLDGDIIAGGNITLAGKARTGTAPSFAPTVATITLMNPVPADSDRTHVFTIQAGGDFKMGPNEKLTVIGALNLSAGAANTATISDISTFGSMTVSAGTILLQTRAPGYTLTQDGQVASLDHGLDYFAGGDMTFNGHLLAFDPLKNTAPHAAGAKDVSFGVLGGNVGGSSDIAKFPYHVNTGKSIDVASFLYQVVIDPKTGLPVVSTFDPSVTLSTFSNVSFTLLDATPSGPSSTVITSVLAQVLPAQTPTPFEDENISSAALAALADMGVYARPLTDDEKIQKAMGQVVYLELPMPTEDRPSEYKIAAARIPSEVALDMLRARAEILGKPPADPAARAAWEADVQQKIQKAIADAYLEYQDTLKDTDTPTGGSFREFLEGNRKKYALVLDTFQRIRVVSDKVHDQLGLTDARLADCKNLLIKGLVPSGLDTVDNTFVLEAAFHDSAAAAAKREKELKEKEKVASLSARAS